MLNIILKDIFMGFFGNKKAKEKLLGVATNYSIQAMTSYLRSRKQYEERLTIFF